MSLTASITILVVLAVRVLLRRLPKIYSYLLWVVVIFRLVCPVSFELPQAPMKPVRIEHYIEHQVGTIPTLEVASNTDANFVIERTEEISRKTSNVQEASNTQDIYLVLSYVWVVGITAMITWGIYSGVSIKSQLKNSRKYSGYYTHTGIDNSFIFGIVRPRIFIPASIEKADRTLILKHEQTHLKRGDHIAKIFMYFVLCLHWFNPLVWISFKFFEQDMEMSCDEKVTSKMDKELRAQYAEALLKASAKPIAAFTACFGESGTKRRIMNMLKFKKPTKVMAIVCATLVLVTGCALGVNRTNEETKESIAETTTEDTTVTSAEIPMVTTPTGGDCDIVETSADRLETPPIGHILSDGTYNCAINMYDIYETQRVEIAVWDYFEMSSDEVNALQDGDIIDARQCEFGEEITVEITPLITDGTIISRYGCDYDEVIQISPVNDGYSLYHLANTDTWRLFEVSDTPAFIQHVATCMPLSDDLVIYDQASYFIDSGDISGNCYVEHAFENTFYNGGGLTQYLYNTITIENGEITSITIYMHP